MIWYWHQHCHASAFVVLGGIVLVLTPGCSATAHLQFHGTIGITSACVPFRFVSARIASLGTSIHLCINALSCPALVLCALHAYASALQQWAPAHLVIMRNKCFHGLCFSYELMLQCLWNCTSRQSCGQLSST